MTTPSADRRPKVTVYIPCHNYGRYLRQAVESVMNQSYADWELLIVDDGSEDETARIGEQFQDRDPGRIRFLRQSPPRGLQSCANWALREAYGEYVIRLDADDFLDENALLVLVSYLDSHPETALVYPNYIYVDEAGNVLGVEQRKRIGQDAQLLDLPAHGAGTLIRKKVLKSLGGYDERNSAQDGHEIWLKVLHRYGVANVPTPLFFYRQHPSSKSNDAEKLLEARRKIKRRLVEERNGSAGLRICAVVTAKNSYAHLPNVVLNPLAGAPLIRHTLDAALEAGCFETILVTTDDPKVAEYCRQVPSVDFRLRPSELSGDRVLEAQVALDAVRYLEQDRGIYPDILVLLSVHSPLRGPKHIREAIDTLILYDTDSVLSVYEDWGLHYVHGSHGLTPLNPAMQRQIRLEREGLYESNGAIRALWRDALTETEVGGARVGHIVMSREESHQIKSPLDLWLIEQILLRREGSLK